MLFQQEHIDQIRTGEKTVTRRDWDRRQVKVGGVYIASTEMFTSHEEADCYVRVTGLREERLGDITDRQARREGGYTARTFRTAWSEINGGWDPDLTVYVVEFEYVGTSKPEEGDG